MDRNLPHLIPTDTAISERFTSPRSTRSNPLIPERQPHMHGEHLLHQLREIETDLTKTREERLRRGLEAGGMVLEFESDPNYELIYKSLENARNEIELLNVSIRDERIIAVVLVPDGKLSFFINRVEQYLKEPEPNEKRKNSNFIESIANVRRAVLRALWTDDDIYYPRGNVEAWWEVWLKKDVENDIGFETFQKLGVAAGINISEQRINFVDRTVLLIKARESMLQSIFDLIDVIAELRRARVSTNLFINIPAREQKEWVQSILDRLVVIEQPSNSVALLDTGVNNGHPLIQPFLSSDDLHSFDPNWDVADHNGHGTEMAGIAIYGDLIEVLEGKGDINIPYCLESVKVLPPDGQSNDPQLYGHITLQSVARLEINKPERKRVYALAITSGNSLDYGKPSSWSAAIDSDASTDWSEDTKLYVISIGNIGVFDPSNYPQINFQEQVEDPAQAWNAISVGALTHKIWVDEDVYPNWDLVAPYGDLSPSSRTSITWGDPWPYKPDVVMEGGNQVWNPVTEDVDSPESLSMLTTYYQPASRLFAASGDTSAATYLVAKACAKVYGQYPHLWPETVRALIVHSAEWNEQMIARFQTTPNSIDVEKLVRVYGYGEVDETRAILSAGNSPTVIIQDELQPFFQDGAQIKTHEMHVHELPWPYEELMSLEDIEVKLRVTLSYFIEPNPARRGWNIKHTYSSHGLRFDIKTPTESIDQFRCRINKAARQDDTKATSKVDSKNWFLGPQKRCRGSLHSDIWTGTAVQLAEKGYIAVYPTVGWWSTRKSANRWDRKARYALILTLEVAGVEIDLYSSIATQIGVPVEVHI